MTPWKEAVFLHVMTVIGVGLLITLILLGGVVLIRNWWEKRRNSDIED